MTIIRLAARRLSSWPRQRAVGVSFDIDGVLLRGATPLPGARDALRSLDAAGVPYVFLTNGGGEREWKKAAKLEALLGVRIHPEQVILSHTPLKPVIARHAADRILVLGCREVMDVAASYGATRACDIAALARDDPTRYPFISYERRAAPYRHDPFAAVFMLHDPNDWGVEVQITLDVLRGGGFSGASGGADGAAAQVSQRVPLYASNPDITFAGAHPVPRLAAGAFIVALGAVWREVTGTELAVQQVGKPTAATFAFAAAQLCRWAALSDGVLPRAAAALPHAEAAVAADALRDVVPAPLPARLFHIGDNPAADVRGANRAGDPWRSVLVRTGVFRGEGNDAIDPAHVVVDDVTAAVGAILHACPG